MTKPKIASILAQASNCFYLLLDAKYFIQFANDHFTSLFGDQPLPDNTSFFQFLDPLQVQKWQSFFETVSPTSLETESFECPLETTRELLLVCWNIMRAGEDTGCSYELLGVVKGKIQDNALWKKRDGKLLQILTQLRSIINSSPDIICTVDGEGKFIRISAAVRSILGYEPREMVGQSFLKFVHEDDIDRTLEVTRQIKEGTETTLFENTFYRKDGSLAPLIWSSKWEEADKRFYSVARDGTAKKEAEQALRLSEEKYRVLFYNHPLPMWIFDTSTHRYLEVNETAIQLLGYSREEFIGLPVSTFLVENEKEMFEELMLQNQINGQEQKGLWTHKKKTGEKIILEITANALNYENRIAEVVLGIDRTERVKHEEELLKSNERYLFLSQATFDAIWDWNLETGEVAWNEGVKKMFDIPLREEIASINWWYNNLHDDDRERVINKLNTHIQEGRSHWEDEYRFRTGVDSYINIYDRAYTVFEGDKAVRMIGAMQDLTERKAHENLLQKLNNSLEKRARELAESNTELERFAYVASHDLQEPLRMVTSFLQLLEKRYKDKLDHKAHEYIEYAVDGAERMKRLILDLLEYSKVNSTKVEKEDIDLNNVIRDLQHTYKNYLAETNGSINQDKLPIVRGNKTQLLQLFQNLVSNAFKYRSTEPPVINISCTEDNKQYEFVVTDNGIGIDPKYFSKIFVIFQRLHNRDQYSGTGIGLAICKKIIDKHGGKIWVNSLPGHGSSFHFTLPKPK